MNQQETMTDPEIDAPKPRKGRTQKADLKVCVRLMVGGKPKDLGTFPEAAIGEPLERRLLPFLEERNYGPGDYKIEIKKPNGQFERSFDFSIAATDSDSEHERIIDVDLDEFDEEQEPEELSFADNTGQMNKVEVKNLFLTERIRRLEEDAQRHKSGNQGETQSLVSALQEAQKDYRDLLLMTIQQAQKPQQDATLQAMSMLEKSFGMITKARALSEEIAPTGSGEGSGGILADGAKIIDSLGRAAPTFLPILAGMMPKAPQAPVPAFRSEAPFVPVTNENGSGELADLAGKIQKKESAKK